MTETTDFCAVCRKDVGMNNVQLALQHLYAVRSDIISIISGIDSTLDSLKRFSHVEITDG